MEERCHGNIMLAHRCLFHLSMCLLLSVVYCEKKSKLSIEQEGLLPSEESRLLSIAGNTQRTDLCAQCVTELLSEVKLVPFMALQLFFALVITQMQSILMFTGRK